MRKSKPENAGPRAIKDLLAPMRDAVEAKAPPRPRDRFA
jgi:hypothetical protein